MLSEEIELTKYYIEKLERECSNMHLSVLISQNASPATESLFKLNTEMLESHKNRLKYLLNQNGKQ